MALEVQNKIISQSRDARVLTLKDSTGLEAAGRLTGYGTTNGTVESILSHIFQFSLIGSSSIYTLKVDGTDPLLPTNVQIGNGRQFSVTGANFKDDNGISGDAEMFKDGVVNLDMFAEFAGLTGVTITSGLNYMIGGNFKEALKADSVIVNGKIYSIDKSPNYAQQGYDRLFITGTFADSATSFTVAYRSTTKGLLLNVSENISSYACKQLRNDVDHPDWRYITVALAFRESAKILFNAEVPDLPAAQELVEANYKLLNRFIC